MTRWQPAYVGLGSNLDDPAAQIERATGALAELPGSRLVSHSPLYRSAPMGPADQPDFVNAAAGLLTTLAPRALLDALLGLEVELGRPVRRPRWGPRRIDLDLLVYAGCQINEPGLCVPHPGIAARRFVLQPLADIAPDLWLPGLGRVSKILKVCDSDPVHLITGH